MGSPRFSNGAKSSEWSDVKKGVVGVFAASRFKLDEPVRLKDEKIINLTQYARGVILRLYQLWISTRS